MRYSTAKKTVSAILAVLIIAAMSINCFAAVGGRDWAWPVPGINRLSSCFGDGRNHNAIDIVAARGTPVVASYSGTVVKTYKSCTKNYAKSGNCTCGGCYNLGNYVYIEHTYNGVSYVSRYGHLTDVYVSVGDTVAIGQTIGTVGCTGRSTGDHLDFQIYEGTYSSRVRYVDPLKESFVMPIEGLNAYASNSSCCYSYVTQVLRTIAGQQYYLDKCKVTDYTAKTYIASCDCSIMFYPCTRDVFVNSYELGTVSKGEEFTATQLILNTESENWLKITTLSGVTGYISLLNALDCTLIKGMSKLVALKSVIGYATPDKASQQKVYSAGNIITFVGHVIDQNGQIFFMSTDGYFFPQKSISTPQYISSIKIEGTPYAYGCIKKGATFYLNGTVSSENTITGIEVYVYDLSGNTYLSKYVSVRCNSYEFYKSELDSAMSFGNLDAGTYIFSLVISEESKGINGINPFQTTLNSYFTIGGDYLSTVNVIDNDGFSKSISVGDTYTTFLSAKKPMITDYNVPKDIEKGSSFSIYGTVYSISGKLKDITVNIIDSRGYTVQTKSYNPDSMSGSVKKLDAYIKFGSLDVGSYYYQVKATNESCTETLVYSPFSVYSSVSGSLNNITEKSAYDGRFTDVPANEWYSENIAYAYALTLLNGKSDTSFDPEGTLTVAECITLAVNINCAYRNVIPVYEDMGEWYEGVAKYALENGIIKHGYTNYEENITRAEAMIIFANCLSGDALSAINTVPDGAIPDCPTDSTTYSAVYALFRAGIINGVDSEKRCAPNSLFTRAEAATIIVRIAKRDRRVSVTF